MERYYRRAFAEFLARDPEKYADKYGWRTVDDMWHWWLEDGVLPGQVSGLEEIDMLLGDLERERWEGRYEADHI